MNELPKPSFSTDDEIAAGAGALAQAGDTTQENVENAIVLGEMILDGPLAHVRWVMKDGNLLYHVFRGKGVPEKFWGEGEYGLVLLEHAESYWRVDKPQVEYHANTCRAEVYADEPGLPSKYPDHFYSAYLIVVPGVDRKLSLDEKMITGWVVDLERKIQNSIQSWSNGS